PIARCAPRSRSPRWRGCGSGWIPGGGRWAPISRSIPASRSVCRPPADASECARAPERKWKEQREKENIMASAVAARLDSIKANAGVQSREIAQLLDTTPQTISRWQQGKVDPHSSKLQQLLTLEWLTDQLGEFYGPEEARLWLFSRHRLLGGESPADRIQ